MALADAAIPALAGVVSAAFAALVAKQFLERRRPHQLAWTVGLGAYSIASVIEAFVAANAWTVGLYRVYFPLAAGLVGFLGAGTIYLLGKPRVGHAFAGVVLGLFLVMALGQFAVPLTAESPVTMDGDTRPLREWGTDLGAKAVPFPSVARVASLVLNIGGGLALIVGALWSYWQTRAAGVLLIGLGAMLPFTGGSLSTLGVVDARVVAQFAGIVVMFAGYLAGSAAKRRTRPDGAAAPTR